MEHSSTYEANAVHDNHNGTKEIWRTFWILLILTLVELALGFYMIGVQSSGGRLAIKGAIIILMLAKAFYIVAYFMHLKGELKNLIMTIVVPLALLIWGIVAFLYDGNSFLNNRMRYDRFKNASATEKVEKKAEEPAEKKPGAME